MNEKCDTVLSLGFYTGSIIGYTIIENNNKTVKPKIELKPIFGYRPHVECVRGIISYNSVLATGSSDENIRIYNIKDRKELGYLSSCSSSVISLDIMLENNVSLSGILICGCEDGFVYIWECSDWTLIKKYKKHNGPVVDVSIHFSCCIALSISSKLNGQLCVWDVTKKKAVMSQNIEKDPISVRWSVRNYIFGILFASKLVIYDLENTKSDYCIYRSNVNNTIPNNFTCFSFLPSNHIVIGDASGYINYYSLSFNKEGYLCSQLSGRVSFDGSTDVSLTQPNPIKAYSRIKQICPVYKKSKNGKIKKNQFYIATVTSSGLLSLWNIHQNCQSNIEYEQKPTAYVNLESRVTSMCCNTQKIYNESNEDFVQ